MSAPLPGKFRALHDGEAEAFWPGRLWSLREMLDRHVYLFVAATNALTEFRLICAKLAQSDPNLPAHDSIIEIAPKHTYLLRQAYILSDMQDKIGPLERLDNSVNVPEGHPLRNAKVLDQEVRHFLLGLRDLLEQEY